MATPIKQIAVGDTNYNIRGYFYGTCITAGGTAEKAIVCPEFTADDLADGTVLIVNNTVAGTTYTSVKLNVNYTGANDVISHAGTTVINIAEGWKVGELIFVCKLEDNTPKWVYANQDLNTTYSTPINDKIQGWTVNRYASCSTAAGTAAKTASVTNGTVTLAAGLAVYVKFTNANTASTPTLNINSKGTKNIFYNGAQITTGDEKSLLKGTCLFVYDGTQWHLIPSGSNAGSTYTGTSPITVSGTAISHADSGATAGSYGSSAGATLAHGGTFTVPYVTVDAKGHVTSIADKAFTLPSDSDTKVTVTRTTDSAASQLFYLIIQQQPRILVV